MDIWLLLCTMFVALATFEYAVLLGIRFGKGRTMPMIGGGAEDKEMKCNQVDRISLIMFIGIFILVVVAYFIVVNQGNY